MPANAERVIACLREHPTGLDDDEISSLLAIEPRQQLNSICRKLVVAGVVMRRPNADPTRRMGKLVNTLTAAHET